MFSPSAHRSIPHESSEGAGGGNAATQNELADKLRASGVEPRSPRPDEPNFDLAWESNGRVFVAEVKSITPRNEERQLRLGLGQVLRYRDVMMRAHTRYALSLSQKRLRRTKAGGIYAAKWASS